MNILHNVGLFFWFPTSLFLNKTGDHMDALPYLRSYTNKFCYTELFVALFDNCKIFCYFIKVIKRMVLIFLIVV